MSNDKHQALRDAAQRSLIVTVGSHEVRAVLADYDRMREALKFVSRFAIEAPDTPVGKIVEHMRSSPVYGEALKECEQ